MKRAIITLCIINMGITCIAQSFSINTFVNQSKHYDQNEGYGLTIEFYKNPIQRGLFERTIIFGMSSNRCDIENSIMTNTYFDLGMRFKTKNYRLKFYTDITIAFCDKASDYGKDNGFGLSINPGLMLNLDWIYLNVFYSESFITNDLGNRRYGISLLYPIRL